MSKDVTWDSVKHPVDKSVKMAVWYLIRGSVKFRIWNSAWRSINKSVKMAVRYPVWDEAREAIDG